MSPILSAASRPGLGEFPQRHAAFGLEPDVDDGEILFDPDDDALDDRALDEFGMGKALFEKCGEVLLGRSGDSGHAVS